METVISEYYPSYLGDMAIRALENALADKAHFDGESLRPKDPMFYGMTADDIDAVSVELGRVVEARTVDVLRGPGLTNMIHLPERYSPELVALVLKAHERHGTVN